ncbi:mitogen-activated protein kinase kinase kinase 17-like protein [Tanacetum coccineum]
MIKKGDGESDETSDGKSDEFVHFDGKSEDLELLDENSKAFELLGNRSLDFVKLVEVDYDDKLDEVIVGGYNTQLKAIEGMEKFVKNSVKNKGHEGVAMNFSVSDVANVADIRKEITNKKYQMVFKKLLEFESSVNLVNDIKESNGKGVSEIDAKFGDLGLEKRIKHVKTNLGCYWRVNPLYFSLESVISGVQKRVATDIWVFGCIVFEILNAKQIWLAYKNLGKNKVLRCVGYENEIETSNLSNEGKSILEKLVKNDDNKGHDIEDEALIKVLGVAEYMT